MSNPCKSASSAYSCHLYHHLLVTILVVTSCVTTEGVLEDAGAGGGDVAETGGDNLWGYRPVARIPNLPPEPSRATPACYIQPRMEREHKDLHTEIHDLMLGYSLNLIDYTIAVYNRTGDNPLETNNTWNYKSQYWSRVRSTYGRTMLSLAFNYKILSLLTFTVSVEEFNITVEDVPLGCLAEQYEVEKVLIVRDLLLRDFDPTGPMTVVEGEDAVCHQVCLSLVAPVTCHT